MADTERQPESFSPSPLNRDEIAALAGAATVVVGTTLHALHLGFGEAKSLQDFAKTATVILCGGAAFVIWSVARRRLHEVTWRGLLILLCLQVFAICVWLENVRDPVNTFLGTMQAEFRPMAWVVIATGSAAIQYSGIRARHGHTHPDVSSQTHAPTSGVGAILAVLGCLLGLALANPFRDGAPADLRRLSRSYKDELQCFHWILLGLATFCIVACFQYPQSALRIVKNVVRITVIIVGAGIFVLLSLAFPQTRILAMPIGVAWAIFAIITCANVEKTHAITRWKRLVIASPFASVFGLLLLNGEMGDLTVYCYPVFAIVAGFVICRNTRYVDTAIFGSALVIGLPTVLMAFGGVPNEIADLLGLSVAEARFGAFGVCCLLGWAVLLAFQDDGVNLTAQRDIEPQISPSSRAESS